MLFTETGLVLNIYESPIPVVEEAKFLGRIQYGGGESHRV